MRRVVLFVLGILWGSEVAAQVTLPYTTKFAAASQAAVRNAWAGPWDQNLGCDGLDSLRFGPTCCTQGQVVPWLGMSPFNYNCQHTPSDSGGAYLRLVKNYSAGSSLLLSVWSQPEVSTPQFTASSMALLRIRAAKNTMHMTHYLTPWSNPAVHGNNWAYTALEVALVSVQTGQARVLDTLVLSNTWSTFQVDSRQFAAPFTGTYRFRLRLLGDGDAALDWARLEASPEAFWTITPSCSPNTPNGSIALDSVTGMVPPLNVSWAHGATGSSLSNLAPGAYTATLTDAQGHFARRTLRVLPSLGVAVDSVRRIGTLPGAAWLSATGTGPFVWFWTGPGGFQSSAQVPLVSVPGVYTATVVDANACVNTTSVSIGLVCASIPPPPAWNDSVCFGSTPTKLFAAPAIGSLVLRLWTSPTDTSWVNAQLPLSTWNTAVVGSSLRYARWVDTLQHCTSPATTYGLWVFATPTAPAALSVLRCPSTSGYAWPWPTNSSMEWATPGGTQWNSGPPPALTASQTNSAGAAYVYQVRAVDTIGGCRSAPTTVQYQVKNVILGSLNGPTGYSYGMLHNVSSFGFGSGPKTWTVSSGGTFEVPNNSAHPCHNQTSCVTATSNLSVRGSTVPCWNPPTVTVSVSIAPPTTACDSLSNLSAQTSASYSCFGTQLAQAPALAKFVPGGALRVAVATSANSYALLANPLAMSYASCSHTLPHQWQLRAPGDTAWAPLASAFPGISFQTVTDTNEIILAIAAADSLLDGYEVRLQLERCLGVFGYSSATLLRSNLGQPERSISGIRILPNPALGPVSVEWPQGALGRTWWVHRIDGRLIAQGRVESESSQLTLPPGSYVLGVEGVPFGRERVVVLPGN